MPQTQLPYAPKNSVKWDTNCTILLPQLFLAQLPHIGLPFDLRRAPRSCYVSELSTTTVLLCIWQVEVCLLCLMCPVVCSPGTSSVPKILIAKNGIVGGIPPPGSGRKRVSGVLWALSGTRTTFLGSKTCFSKFGQCFPSRPPLGGGGGLRARHEILRLRLASHSPPGCGMRHAPVRRHGMGAARLLPLEESSESRGGSRNARLKQCFAGRKPGRCSVQNIAPRPAVL